MKIAALVFKEVRELLTPATILPAIFMMLIFAGMGGMIGGMEKKAMEKPNVEIITHDNESYASFYTSILKKYCNEGKENIAVIEIPSNFSSLIKEGKKAEIHIKWLLKGTGIAESASITAVRKAIEIANNELVAKIVEEKKINASIIFSPVEYDEYTIIKNREVAAAPEKIISFFSSQSMSIPIVIMIMIVTSGGIVISSMGMEKENKTLETLLTLPIKRSYIVTGKIIGATIVGAIIAFLYMLGLRYYISSFGMQEKLAGFNLNGMDYALISISLFFSLLAGLSLCLVIGSFAKNYKSAQILSLPVSILAIIPMFILMFQDFSSMSTPLKAIIFSIPFSHPMMAPSLLLLDEYSLVVYGIVYSAIFSIICILIATWIFKTDLLITGRIRK